MSEIRKPWWAHNAVEEQLALGKKFRPCSDGCGMYLMIVRPPRDANGKRGDPIPVSKIGEEPNPSDPTKFVGVYAIHFDICVNPRIPGARDPTRSHRIAVNEDKPEFEEEQARFNLRRPDPMEG